MLHQNQCRPLPLLVLAALLLLAGPALAQRARLTHADTPVQLIRKTTVFDATAGSALYPGDLVGGGARGAQVEWPAGVLLALGPGSIVAIDDAAAFPAVTLLRGWVKAAGPRLSVAAGPLALVVAGSAIVRADGANAELFVERGTLTVSAPERAPLALGREQYVLFQPPAGLHAPGRTPRGFVAALPPAFFDPLVAVGARVPAAAPVPVREASAADVAQWNDSAAPVRRQLALRFAPRLADPAFRAGAATLLANQAEWRQALKDGAPSRKHAHALPNTLF